MSTAIESRSTAASYTSGVAHDDALLSDAILADALGCVVGGRPLPAALRPAPAPVAAPPATVEEGIRRILTACAAMR